MVSYIAYSDSTFPYITQWSLQVHSLIPITYLLHFPLTSLLVTISLLSILKSLWFDLPLSLFPHFPHWFSFLNLTYEWNHMVFVFFHTGLFRLASYPLSQSHDLANSKNMLLLAQEHILRSMEQNREPRNGPTNVWPTQLWQNKKEHPME